MLWYSNGTDNKLALYSRKNTNTDKNLSLNLKSQQSLCECAYDWANELR